MGLGSITLDAIVSEVTLWSLGACLCALALASWLWRRRSSSTFSHRMVAIVPCTDLDASEAFYARLSLVRSGPPRPSDDTYRILADGLGAHVHLTTAVEGWLVPRQNPFGLYLYTREVDAAAARFHGQVIERDGPSAKPWGMYEFALSDPDETLVRVGCPVGQQR